MLSFEIQRALLKNFDYLVAVDTNTRTINTRNVSVTAVVTFKEASPPPGARAYWKLDVPFCWEFIDLRTDKIENLGWIAALEQLYAAGHVAEGTRIGMIVDSDLGNIPAFNDRTLLVFEQSVLPAGVQLIYASADSGSENVINRVLQSAHDASKQVLDAISVGAVDFNKCERPGRLHAGARLVNAVVETYDFTV
jgi:hypothetical protein